MVISPGAAMPPDYRLHQTPASRKVAVHPHQRLAQQCQRHCVALPEAESEARERKPHKLTSCPAAPDPMAPASRSTNKTGIAKETRNNCSEFSNHNNESAPILHKPPQQLQQDTTSITVVMLRLAGELDMRFVKSSYFAQDGFASQCLRHRRETPPAFHSSLKIMKDTIRRAQH